MLQLKIVSPERVEFEGEVDRVVVPGTLGRFEVLTGHAPIISSLETGHVEFFINGQSSVLPIAGGLVEVQKDKVSLCVELSENKESVG